MATTKVLLGFSWNKSKDGDVRQVKDKINISDSVLKVAKKELREDKTTREQALEQMRDWLKKNYDVENIRTDDSFLLRFLRNKKFSVPMAQQQLLKYLNMRKVMGHLSYNLDFLSPGVKGLIDNGYIMMSPIRDKYGRRTILYFACKFVILIVDDDASSLFLFVAGLNGVQYTQVDQVQAHYITYETLMESQEEQILGIVHIGDFAGASTSHVSLWKNPVEFLKILKWGEQSMPLRHKEIHLYNIATMLKYVIDAAKQIITSKMRDRVHVSFTVLIALSFASFHFHYTQTYVTEDDLKKKIVNVDVLPKEMGGKVPMAEMLELFKMELATSRNTLLALDQMKILNDSGIIGRRNVDKNNNSVSGKSEQVIGSFRKLEID